VRIAVQLGGHKDSCAHGGPFRSLGSARPAPLDACQAGGLPQAKRLGQE
jgi:hypothetical protein